MHEVLLQSCINNYQFGIWVQRVSQTIKYFDNILQYHEPRKAIPYNINYIMPTL